MKKLTKLEVELLSMITYLLSEVDTVTQLNTVHKLAELLEFKTNDIKKEIE